MKACAVFCCKDVDASFGVVLVVVVLGEAVVVSGVVVVVVGAAVVVVGGAVVVVGEAVVVDVAGEVDVLTLAVVFGD